MAKQKEGFYTAEGVDVEKRIEEGKTRFIQDRRQAEAFANSRRSYYYEMFNLPTSNSRKLIGYGIPR